MNEDMTKPFGFTNLMVSIDGKEPVEMKSVTIELVPEHRQTNDDAVDALRYAVEQDERLKLVKAEEQKHNGYLDYVKKREQHGSDSAGE